ncbi:MAG: HlyD family type I secretion periplasmic adaptor subunit [Thiobacillaceae bacterium]|nr:HlyD family type I secretion periplasmic adaptor subunit [Thiobacillaceae bacterium]
MLPHTPTRPKTIAPPIEGEISLPTDARRPARLGLWALAIGFGGFLLWAAFAPLDEGVPTYGYVTHETKRKAVQHASGGIVKEIRVREGQRVKSGEVLLRLDDAASRAAYAASRLNYATLRAMESRLLAEHSGLTRVSFPQEIADMAHADGEIGRILDNQAQLFQTRRSALATELSAVAEAIRGQEAALQGLDSIRVARETQLRLLNEELKGLRGLVEEGYAPRSRLLELERHMAETSAALADIAANIQRARSAIAELRSRARLREQEYRKEVEGQLAEVRRQVEAERERLHALTLELQRTEIRAPADGQVVGLGIQTIGGVISPGQKLMEIVPEHERLILEAHIPPHLIDSAKRGDTADVRFVNFAHSPQLTVQARILSVSNDLILEPNQPPYYLARLEITPEGLRKLGGRQLTAGMPVEVVIKTGERSLLTYLLHPLTKRIAASLKEE